MTDETLRYFTALQPKIKEAMGYQETGDRFINEDTDSPSQSTETVRRDAYGG